MLIGLAVYLLVESCVLIALGFALLNLLKRFDRLRSECAQVMFNQQNYLAVHSAALNRLGARVEAVPTGEELQTGHWLR